MNLSRTASGRYTKPQRFGVSWLRRGQPGPSGPRQPLVSCCQRKNFSTSWWAPRSSAVWPQPGRVWSVRQTNTKAVKLPRPSVIAGSSNIGTMLWPITSGLRPKSPRGPDAK